MGRAFCSQSGTNMPILSYFAIVGSVLVALLFVADATLEKSGPLPFNNESVGLPKPWQPEPKGSVLTATVAPEPDMTLKVVRDAQPKPEPQDPVKIHPEARAARAEAPPQDTRVMQPMNYQYRRSQVLDRFSIKGQ